MMRAHIRTVAGALLLLSVPVVGGVDTAHAAAGSRTITGQAAYTCISAAKGLPNDTQPVSIQYSLTVPASVTPGQTVSLTGTAAGQVSESARQKATLLGVSSFDMLSTTLTLVVTVGGRHLVLKAPRWETGPAALANPPIATGPISFPSFTVPAGASGKLTLQLPQNDTVDTSVARSAPARVAFTAVTKMYGGAVNGLTSNSGCYSPSSNPPVFASVPVTAKSAASAPTTAMQATGGRTSAPTTAAGAATAPSPATASEPAGQQAPAAGGKAAVTPAGEPAAAGTAGAAPVTDAALVPQAAAAAAPRSDGVYVSTSALVLVGFAICVSCLVYAALAGYRLRSIRKALDD